MRGAEFCPKAMLMICRKMCPRTPRQLLYCLVTLHLQCFMFTTCYFAHSLKLYVFTPFFNRGTSLTTDNMVPIIARVIERTTNGFRFDTIKGNNSHTTYNFRFKDRNAQTVY